MNNRIPDYPPPQRALDGSEPLAAWQDGQQRALPVLAVAEVALDQIRKELDPNLSAYGSWLLLPGNAGKSIEEFLRSLHGLDADLKRADFVAAAGGQSRFPAIGNFPFPYSQQTLQPVIETSIITDRAAYSFENGSNAVIFTQPVAAGKKVVFYSALLNAPMVNTGRGQITIRDKGGHQDNPDNTQAFADTMIAARRDGLIMVEDRQYQYKMDRGTIPPGIGGIIDFSYAPSHGAKAPGLCSPGRASDFVDNRDRQDDVARNMRFEGLRYDGRNMDGRPFAMFNAQGIRVYDLQAKNLTQFAGTADSGLKDRFNTFGVNFSSFIDADDEAADIIVEQCIIDGTPLGAPSAGNRGPLAGYNVGGEATPFPYTDPNTGQVEVAETYQENVKQPDGSMLLVTNSYARAEAIYKQFGIAIPTPKKVHDYKLIDSKAIKTYYGAAFSGVVNFDALDNEFIGNIRSTDVSNGNRLGRLLRNAFDQYSSVGGLQSYFNELIEWGFNKYRTDRCAGAAALLLLHGMTGITVHNEDILGIRNTEAGNPDGKFGEIPRALIAALGDITGLDIYDNLLAGLCGIAPIDIASAFGTALTNPLHFGRSGGENNAKMSHAHSTGIKVRTNRFAATAELINPSINLTSITDTLGTYEVHADIVGNMQLDPNWSEMMRAVGMQPDTVIIDQLTGNEGAGGRDAVMTMINAKVITRDGNAGDPGSDAAKEGSVGSLPTPFPGGQIRYPVDNARPVISRDRGWFGMDGSAVTPIVSLAAFAGTNIARTGNVYSKTTPDGQWDGVFHSTGTIASGVSPEIEAIVRAGSFSSIGFNDVATATTFAQTQLQIVYGDGGDVLAYLGGDVFQNLRLRSKDGDKVTYLADRTTGRALVTVGTRSMETPLSALANAPVYPEGAIYAKLEDLVYAGASRGGVPGALRFTTFPVVTVQGGGAAQVGKTLVVNPGVCPGASGPLSIIWLRGFGVIPGAMGTTYTLTAGEITGNLDADGFAIGKVTPVVIAQGGIGLVAQAMPASLVVTA